MDYFSSTEQQNKNPDLDMNNLIWKPYQTAALNSITID